MPQSRRQSNSQPQGLPYISSSKSFVQVPRPHHGNNNDEGGGGDDDDDDDDDDDEIFDVEEEEREISRLTKLIEPDYLHQVVEPTVTDVNLKTVISESAQEIRNLTKPLEYLETVGAELAEFSNSNDEIKHILEQIDRQARQVIEEIQLVEIRKKELEEFRELVHRSSRSSNRSNSFNLQDQLFEKISTQFLNWNSLSLRQKFAQNKDYKKFRERIWEASGAQGIMPHLKTFLPADDGEEEESDSSGDELEIGGATQNYKCPLCIGYLKVPLVSQLCRHAFCKGCFEDYLSQNDSAQVSCPATGCSQFLTSQLVQNDDSLAARVRQFVRREETRRDELNFDDELSIQNDQTPEEEDSKPSRATRTRATTSQRRRRVVVDDDNN